LYSRLPCACIHLRLEFCETVSAERIYLFHNGFLRLRQSLTVSRLLFFDFNVTIKGCFIVRKRSDGAFHFTSAFPAANIFTQACSLLLQRRENQQMFFLRVLCISLVERKPTDDEVFLLLARLRQVSDD